MRRRAGSDIHRSKQLVTLFWVCFSLSAVCNADSLTLAERLCRSDAEERNSLLQENKEQVDSSLIDNLLTCIARMNIPEQREQAVEISKLAKKISDQIHYSHGAATSLNQLGRLYQIKEDYSASLSTHRQALAIAEQKGDLKEEASALCGIAILQELLGDYDASLKNANSALKKFEELLDQKGIADTLQILEKIYYRLGENQKSLEFGQRSLKLRERVGDQVGVASSYLNLSNPLAAMGRLEEASNYLKKAVPVFESSHDWIQLSATLNGLANYYFGQGNFRVSLEYHLKNLKLSREQKLQRGTALALINMGAVFESQGELELARDHYQKSFQLADSIGSALIAVVALANIAGIEAQLGKYESALKHSNEALKRHEQMGSKSGVAAVLRNIGLIYQLKGDLPNAEKYFLESLKALEPTAETVGLAETHLALANVYHEQKKYQQALESSSRACALSEPVGLSEHFFRAKAQQGKTYLVLENFAKAEVALEEAIETAEQMYARQDDTAAFVETWIDPYQSMVELLVLQKKFKEALVVAERAKARMILSVLKSGRRTITTSMTESERQTEQSLQSSLASLNTEIHKLSWNEKEKRAAVMREVQKARVDLEVFRKNLYVLHPDLRGKRGEVDSLNFLELSKDLDEATAYIEFVSSKDKTFLFIVWQAAHKIHVRAHSIPRSQKALGTEISEFRRQIAERNLGFRDPSKKLFELLLLPIHDVLQTKTRVVIIPDGALWELPFQALTTPSGRYLLELASISYTPSLTVLQEMRKAKQHKSDSLIAFANPELGGDQNLQLSSPGGTEQEVEEISALYGKSQSAVFTKKLASEHTFKQKASRFDVIHLAMHGIIDDWSPMYSRLLFSKGNDAEDDLLEAREILDIPMTASLAVLSACETARGKFKAGEGIIGLSWSFFIAGVPSTVVSQWKVESNSTSSFMIDFHRGLKRNGLSKMEALRNAALTLLHQEPYQHPFYWAGFVLVGDPF